MKISLTSLQVEHFFSLMCHPGTFKWPKMVTTCPFLSRSEKLSGIVLLVKPACTLSFLRVLEPGEGAGGFSHHLYLLGAASIRSILSHLPHLFLSFPLQLRLSQLPMTSILHDCAECLRSLCPCYFSLQPVLSILFIVYQTLLMDLGSAQAHHFPQTFPDTSPGKMRMFVLCAPVLQNISISCITEGKVCFSLSH